MTDTRTGIDFEFLSTPSARRATSDGETRNCSSRFLSTPSARRATAEAVVRFSTHEISIHALREEGDQAVLRRMRLPDISIHALREEGDEKAQLPVLPEAISIHALREEGDGFSTTTTPSQTYFYPRPPRGGRLCVVLAEVHFLVISIHALREEGDLVVIVDEVGFLGISIHALREEGDVTIRPAERYPRISIHALREEGDPGTGGRRCRALSFLSTPSARRATRVRQSERDYEEQFLSTPSARRATSSPSSLGMEIFISIHALREEGDIWERTEERTDEYFYPRPLRGGRLPGFFLASETGKISIHALREEGDAGLRMFHLQWQEFLSTPSARRATSKRSWQSGWPRGFLSTPSARRATFFSVVLHPAQSDFYPRPPRGGRQTVDLLIVDDLGFLSTPSARRATCCPPGCCIFW